MGHLSATLNPRKNGILPSDTVQNPRKDGQCMYMTTMNGKAPPGPILARIEQERNVEFEINEHVNNGVSNEVLIDDNEPEKVEVDPKVAKKVNMKFEVECCNYLQEVGLGTPQNDYNKIVNCRPISQKARENSL